MSEAKSGRDQHKWSNSEPAAETSPLEENAGNKLDRLSWSVLLDTNKVREQKSHDNF